MAGSGFFVIGGATGGGGGNCGVPDQSLLYELSDWVAVSNGFELTVAHNMNRDVIISVSDRDTNHEVGIDWAPVSKMMLKLFCPEDVELFRAKVLIEAIEV